jgi:hypothetical protein
VRGKRALAFSAAVASGFLIGWYLAGRHVERHKADLFSANRYRRLVALSYLATQERVETLHLLRDYLAWEPTVALRNRARRLVRRLEAHLS